MANNSRNSYGFGLGGPLPALTPTPVISTRVPAISDLNFELGTTWINTTTNQAWIMTGSAAGAASWILSSPGASDVDTLTGDAGGAISPVAGNINILGGVTAAVAGAGNTLTVNPSANGYPASPYVVGAAGEAGYATIAAAITAAAASGTDQTIIVQPGTYTEDLTLVDGISIAGTAGDITIITGVHVPPAAGTFSVKGCTLTSATHIFNSAVAGTCNITVNDCEIAVTNGYLFNLLNWTGAINIFDSGSGGGTNDGFISNTGGSAITAWNSSLGAGAGNAYAMSNGAIVLRNVDLVPQGTIGGTATVDSNDCIYWGVMTTAGTAALLMNNYIFHTTVNTSIAYGSAGNSFLDNGVINNSNATAIGGAGAGIVQFGNLSFTDSSVIAGTLTIAYDRTVDRITPYVVGPTGSFATIQAALDAANASAVPQTVFVQPGTYTEDLTLYTNISLVGTSGEVTTIVGLHTPPAAGTVSIKTLTLNSATDVLNSAAAGTTNITINDCDINVTNGYLFNLLNWTGDLNVFDSGSFGTNDGFISNTGGSDITVWNSSLGAGVGNAYAMSGGTVTFRKVDLHPQGTFGGAAVVDLHTCIFYGTQTTAATAQVLSGHCIYHTGATACINHGSAGTFALDNAILNTANNPSVAGAGAGIFTIGNTVFYNDTNLAGTLTLAYNYTTTGLLNATGAHLINSGAGNDITLTMGDAAGANGVIFNDSTGAPVLTIDSNGGIVPVAAFTVAGPFAQTAGQFDVGQDNAANAINIGGGTTARAIGIGNSAAAHTITMGTVTGAASLDLLAGTNNFTLEGNVATTYTISGVGVNTGLITIGGGTGAQQLDMMNVAGVKTVNLANGVDGNTVSILNGVNTGAQILNLASGANAANSTVNVLGGIATAGVQTLNLATGASVSVVNIGNVTGATNVAIDSGTGGIALTSTGAGDITIDSDDTFLVDADGVLELNSSAGIIGIGNDGDAFDINIGTGAAARLVTMGNITGASGIILNSGTGGVQVNTTGAGDYILTSADTVIIDAAGVVELNSTAGAISIGNDDIDQAVNVGTDGERVVTVGSVNGAAQLVLQGGTAGVTMTGLVEDIQTKFVTRTGDDIVFTMSPLTCTWADTGGVATGATGDVNLLSFQEGMIMEQFVLGAGQTIIKPVMTATGLLISGDETTTEGFEYNFGAARANSRHSFTIGTSPAFFLRWTFRADDISGLEPCYIGFRRTQANQAVGLIANYTDFVAYGPNDGIAPGDAAISTQLNTGGLVNTDTNDAWADTATHELTIFVDGAGVVTFEFDGGAPTVTQAVTFDNNDVVHPFFRHEFNAVLPDAIEWIDFQCGFQ